MKEAKYIVLRIHTIDGEREYMESVPLKTYCENIQYAATWYLAHYYYDGVLDRSFTPKLNIRNGVRWWFFGEIVCTIKKITRITKSQYEFLNEVL